MKEVASIAVLLFAGCAAFQASTLETGHVVVTLTDKDTGEPITNATVTVETQTRSSLGYTLDSFFTKTSAQTDTNGIADVEFQFRFNDFDWWVTAPMHYSDGAGRSSERFGSVIVPSAYTHINTNTVEGLAKYNELKALHESDNVEDYISLVHKFEPQSVTYTNNVIYRSVSLYPKHNPHPMYVHRFRLPPSHLRLPQKHDVVVSNGVEISRFRVVDFDMKGCRFLPYNEGQGDSSAKNNSDFKVVRFSVETNDVTTSYGWIEFAPGCGAYRGIKSGDVTFPTRVYEADTNAVFQSRIPYLYHRVGGKRYPQETLLRSNEYMVVRTRAMMDDSGVITNCHYGIIEGGMVVGDILDFEKAIFNPTPNDPNLEAAEGVNLSR